MTWLEYHFREDIDTNGDSWGTANADWSLPSDIVPLLSTRSNADETVGMTMGELIDEMWESSGW